MGMLLYFVIGVCFGIVLTQAEVLSWFRIQEMFRFQSPRMYFIIASAIAVAAGSLALLRRFGVRTLAGEPIVVPQKTMGLGVQYAVGGTLFGLGWALTGACPGPLFALLGNGVGVMAVAIGSALVGTLVYGVVKPRLPH